MVSRLRPRCGRIGETICDPFMAERMLEYAALLRRDLLRAGGAGLTADGLVPAHLPLLVYSGRARWNAPLRVEERTAWAPAGLAELQPRFALRLVDAGAYRGDHARDGNMARAWLALDAADAAGLPAALERAVWTLARIGEAALSRSFEVWCDGVLRPRFGDRMPSLANMMETPTMLAETLREWEERLVSEGREEGRRAGREEGRRTGREEERAHLRRLAEQRFDAKTADALARLLAAADDTSTRSAGQ